LPDILVERLRHYFSTYKMVHGEGSQMIIEKVFGSDYALEVVKAAIEDYEETYGS
jgi:inorganic pyrophosphatase